MGCELEAKIAVGWLPRRLVSGQGEVVCLEQLFLTRTLSPSSCGTAECPRSLQKIVTDSYVNGAIQEPSQTEWYVEQPGLDFPQLLFHQLPDKISKLRLILVFVKKETRLGILGYSTPVLLHLITLSTQI